MKIDETSPSSIEKQIPHQMSILIRPTTPPDDLRNLGKSSKNIRQVMRIRPENHVFQPNPSTGSSKIA